MRRYNSLAFSVPRCLMGQSTSLRPARMAFARISFILSRSLMPSIFSEVSELEIYFIGVID